MIFYYTGTGNSLHAAKVLLHDGEALISMTDARNQGKFAYQRKEGERIGFVYPEFCSSLPDTVYQFVSKMEISGGKGYTFNLVTLGGGTPCGGALLRELLKKKGITLDYFSAVVMPNSCVTLFDTQDAETVKKVLAEGEQQIAACKQQIDAEAAVPVTRSAFIPRLMRPLYYMIAKTKPFAAEDTCTGCGLCARSCPVKAIEMKDGKPVWVKSHCDQCCACINNCPVCAIQYGNKTKARLRYTYPAYLTKK